MAPERPEIEQWLAEQGYSPEVIQKIMLRLESFDAKINRDAVFDAIQTGELDMDAIIKEALGE